MLPETSPEHYLTGTAALSIPTDDGEVADWHFDAAFLRAGTRFRVSGVNFPSTQRHLGSEGVRECSSVLRQRAVPLPEGTAFYAASHARAVLDLVLATTAEHKRPCFLQASDLLSKRDLAMVFRRLHQLRFLFNDEVQTGLIEQWINQQQNANT